MKLVILSLILLSNLWAQIPPHARPGYCPQKKSIACEDYIISRVSPWDVDDDYEYTLLENACAGNVKDECMQLAEKHLPWYEMNNFEDLRNVANACKLTSVSCMNYIIPSLSQWDYNRLDEFRTIARACARVMDTNCIKRRCALRDYNCRRKDDLLKAARKCYEPCSK